VEFAPTVPFRKMIATGSSFLSNPQAVSIRIVDPELGQALKSYSEFRDSQAVLPNSTVILDDIIGVQIQDRVAWLRGVRIDRLIQHQAALVETKHGPPPIIIPFLNFKTQHAGVKIHTGGHALDR